MNVLRCACGLLVFGGLASQPVGAEEAKLKVLVLSGANNHAWQQTTPVIKAALEESGRFSVDVEENVAGMKPQAFAPYAVILSNFNTFGKDASVPVWDGAMKKAFLEHLRKGHGLVIVHAGSSMFYDWPEFQKLACGSWQDGTSHGPIHSAKIFFTDAKSPVTAGLEPFWIRDEFWQNTGLAAGVKALASSSPALAPNEVSKDPTKHNNILFTTEVEGARGFAIFLGHDATAMQNTAWRSLLQRGSEWAATGKVTLPPAKDWPATQADAERMAK